jgi:pyrroline-5-carboxylate reductase
MNNIAFLGGGNIATAIIGGLLKTGYAGTDISVADPDETQRQKLRQLGVRVANHNSQAAKNADVILICVKPDQVETAATSIVPLQPDQLVVSVAAGINTTSLKHWLGSANLVRCMPNTPALIGEGMMALFAEAELSQAHRSLATELMSAVGETRWFEQESDLDVVTAISGSGPAYFFYLMESLIDAAMALGLDNQSARHLVLQTALGTAKMAKGNASSPQELRLQVTSPGGTTQAACTVLKDQALPAIIEEAVIAAQQRSIELGTS